MSVHRPVLLHQCSMKILIVDDDELLVEQLNHLLTSQNYAVDTAIDGEMGWQLIQAYSYDLILLDVMLPKLDGIGFCQRLRQHNNPVLVLLMTARDTTTDKLMGLDSGADDYVVKPLDIQELMARVRALLRRGKVALSPVLNCGDLQLDPSTKTITYKKQKLPLSRKEYMLLELFLRHQHRVFSRGEIIDHLWAATEAPPSEDTVKTHIKTIRRKLEAAGASNWLETIYGQGYRINPIYLKPEETESGSIAAKLQKFNQVTAAIWQRTRETSLQRLSYLEQAATDLQRGNLEETQQQAAIANAHQLAGSLGTFGYPMASQYAKQIESLLRSSIAPAVLVEQMVPLLALLRQIIDPSQPNSQPSPGSGQGAGLLGQSVASIAPSESWSNSTILAVDDDPQILSVIKALLEPLRLEVICLEQPDRFWDTLTTVQPELLILDIYLPGTTGMGLCQQVREHPQWQWLSVIFLSIQTDPDIVRQVFVVGADDYVTKDGLAQELTLRVLNRLQRSRSLRQAAFS